MPPTNERIQNKPLSGVELKEIILKDFADMLDRDGMFSNNLGYPRVVYEVRLSLHLDNPLYPQHVSTRPSRPASKQQVEANSAMAAIESPPLNNPDQDVVSSREVSAAIMSPNMARIEHDMPLKNTVRGDEKDVKYMGDKPSEEEQKAVGNTKTIKDTSEQQAVAWGRPTRAAGKGKASK